MIHHLAKRFVASSTPERAAAARFEAWLVAQQSSSSNLPPAASAVMNFPLLVSASFATFLLHVKSRQASLDGHGFYTIGPCGEEFAACWGALLQPGDTASLHYRHVAAQIARQLAIGQPLESIILDRCRGFACSMNDPVTGGRHCAIGGVDNIVYNTSTLASHVPAAVGRALAGALLPPSSTSGASSPVHFVSLGDGSAHNAAFLAAKNLAENAMYKRIKCPVLFCITDNDLCISLKQHGYVSNQLVKTLAMPVFECDASSSSSGGFSHIHAVSQQAFDHVRNTQKPATLLVRNVLRRFGHAATDRQSAYLDAADIDAFANDDALLQSLCNEAAAAVTDGAGMSFPDMLRLYRHIQSLCESQFAVAAAEPKLDLLSDVERSNQAEFATAGAVHVGRVPLSSSTSPKLTMRKCMTQCIEEQMERDPALVYMGEDVRHGGYYLVTEGLAKRFPKRVLDFPPDETNLIGCGLGFAQRGLVPVVELPYLKYLDCGADQFFEVCLMHWITNGQPKHQPGVIFRLQGFDRGKFGGNFHTHNSLYLPPGLDVLCFSNGRDWARGFREAVRAAKQGRIVALVDSTHALTKRHLHREGDDAWMTLYPDDDDNDDNDGGGSRFEDVTLYPGATASSTGAVSAVIVTYGNGVPDALVVQQQQQQTGVPVDVIDSPLLSKVPGALQEYLAARPTIPVVFADCCKLGQNPHGLYIQHLQQAGVLSTRQWAIVAAPATYNPLSRTTTFLNANMIQSSLHKLLNN